MTRTKSKPSVHKPVFDSESILRFASLETSPVGHDKRQVACHKERTALALMLKAEVVSLLEAEAVRKEKTVAQIVEKLATKHLGKH